MFYVYSYIYNKTNEVIKQNINASYKWTKIRDVLVTANTRLNSKEYNDNNKYKNFLNNILNEVSNLESHEIYDINLVTERRQECEKLLVTIKDNNKKIKPDKNRIKDFEIAVHKDVRANAVKTCCEMYKSAITNLKNGNIKFFNISYKKKSATRKSVGGVPPGTIKFVKSGISLFPGKIGDEHSIFKISSKNDKKYRNTLIQNDSKILYQKGNYFIALSILNENNDTIKTENVCGIDPGLRSIFTIYDKNKITEIKQNRNYFKILNNKIKKLKEKRIRPRNEINILKKRKRKRHLNKIEKKKIDYINSIHWNVINLLIKKYDTILLGDIKSHDIVKNGINSSNNREFNDLKFYIFKQRLIYKAGLAKKHVKLVNEFNTTKCCSSCGVLNENVRESEFFICTNNSCNQVFGRDSNAAKNIFLKGILL
jgi:IS605 OrfB family transposase